MTPEEFFGALGNLPNATPVFYRLYHDAEGMPLFYSMEDLPGTYIEIDQQTYQRNASNVRVRNGKLVTVTWQWSAKLVPGDSGTPCSRNDIAVVVSRTEPHTKWSRQTYEGN
jgi:hypothetical protein